MKTLHIVALCLFVAAGVCYLAAFTGGVVAFVVLGFALELLGLLGILGASEPEQPTYPERDVGQD